MSWLIQFVVLSFFLLQRIRWVLNHSTFLRNSNSNQLKYPRVFEYLKWMWYGHLYRIVEKVSVVIAHLWHANWRISNVGKRVQRCCYCSSCCCCCCCCYSVNAPKQAKPKSVKSLNKQRGPLPLPRKIAHASHFVATWKENQSKFECEYEASRGEPSRSRSRGSSSSTCWVPCLSRQRYFGIR